MMQSIRRLFNDARQLPLAAAVAAAVLTAPAALAADWQPTKPVEIVWPPAPAAPPTRWRA